MPLLALIFAFLALAPAGGAAQGPPAEAPEPGAEISVFVITMGPGDLVWERFGHNALWLQDRATGLDHAYNWGLFSFEQENFILNFIRGRMLYSMAPFPADLTVAHYVEMNRDVVIQELNLTPAQKVELRDFLAWNDRPENRDYLYDYFRDNCSTRVRDALDHALGGALRAQTEHVPSGSTFRSHSGRLTGSDLATYTGIMLGLGQPVDREISRWEEMFVPMKMMEHIRTATVTDEAGRQVPLVRSEQVVFESDRVPPPEAPPGRVPGYLLFGLLLGGTLAAGGRAAVRSGAARAAFSTTAGLWLLLSGTLGFVLAGLWLFTDHAAAHRNENLLHFNPLVLALVFLVPLAIHGSRSAMRPARLLLAVVVGISSLGLLLKVLPAFDQVNGEMIALALPINLGLLVGLELVARGRAGGTPGPRPRTSTTGRGTVRGG